MRRVCVALFLAERCSALVPAAAAPRAKSWRLRESIEDADWPSDGGDDFTQAEDASAAAAPSSSARERLLVAVAGSARGEAGGAENARVERLAAELEASTSTAPSWTLLDLQGRWDLAYSSTQLFRSSPFWLAGRDTCADSEQARQYDWFCEMHRAATRVGTIGAVRQIIDARERTLVSEFETKVAAFPMRVGGAMPLEITGAIVSSADVVDDANGALTLYMKDVEVRGSNIPGLRNVLDAGLKIDSRALSNLLENTVTLPQPRPVLDTTFLDDDLRIARDVDNNLFIYVRETKEAFPTDYDDVSADLGISKVLEGLAFLP